ncbi:glycosyltransferase [Ancylobacter aquaticus]|nr:glycosyltransferase [Ancylobacter aquaticus]
MMEPTPDHPLVTFALFAYNQEQYIREAVEGAFSQTYEPLEIILSDDCSSDQTYLIMQEMAAAYRGPHQVRVTRNEKNWGLAVHVNRIVQSACGEILVIAAGDDVSFPDRTTVSVNLLNDNPNATAVLLSADVINNHGKIIGERTCKIRNGTNTTQTIDDLLSWKHITFGATRAFRREIFMKFGPLNHCCPTEDTPILLRSLIVGTNILSERKAILYRLHENNLSGLASLRKINIPAIYEQYQKDLKSAESLGLVTKKLAFQIRRWIVKDEKIRIIKIKLNSGESVSLRDMFSLIIHPSLNSRDKIKIIARRLVFSKVIQS